MKKTKVLRDTRHNSNAKKAVTVVVAVTLLLTVLLVKHVFFATSKTDLKEIKQDRGDFGEDIIVYDSADGEVVIRNALQTAQLMEITEIADIKTISDPENIWDDRNAYTGKFTYTEDLQVNGEAIGAISIPAIKMSANVYESKNAIEDMDKGIAHFPSTSAFEGNVGVSAHNVNLDGSDGLFKNIHLLRQGDVIQYKTSLGDRNYYVNSVTTIDENDWSPLSYTDDNRITLITCITGMKDKRLCIQALESSI